MDERIENMNRRPVKCSTHISDFANMVKAFIGSNYLSISFAFKQSGLAAGLVGLLIIATLTDHCCHLIVKCKNMAIRKVLAEKYQKSNLEDDSDDEEDLAEIRRSLKRNMNYGDVGRIAMGNAGLYIVNACIIITQFGFCVGYSILIGNTIHSLFPVKTCELFRNSTNYTDIGNCSMNSIFRSDLPRDLQTFHLVTHEKPLHPEHRQLKLLDGRDFIASEGSSNEISNISDAFEGSIFGNFSHNVSNSSTHGNLADTFFLPSSNWTDLTHFVYVSSAPSLIYLVLVPLPIFIAFSYLRHLRHLGPISVAANLSILVGCVSIVVFLANGFSVSKSYKLVHVEGLAVFYGMVTGAFEGIGTIIPIESSMEGNRHNFSLFLHGAISFLTSVLMFFGVLGYIRFGEDVDQMINGNLPLGSAFSFTVNLCLIIGVILTFPLMLFPVVQLTEIYTFTEGRIFGPKKKDSLRETEESDSQSLLPAKNTVLPEVAVVSHEIAAWKRNILRAVLVLMASGIAVVFRNSFAYILAFVGAIGSALLAYLLPCIFHLKLGWSNMSVLTKMKDFTIITLCFICSVFSCYYVVLGLTKTTSV